MAGNDRRVELMSQMLDEQRLVKSERKETNRRLDGFGSGFQSLTTALHALTKRVENIENGQQTTNTILRQHSQDFGRIADLLSERVPHWGDDITIESRKGTVSGTLKKTG